MSAHFIPENLALFLATRQKRLSYLRNAFDPSSMPGTDAKEIQDLLQDYALLMSKLTKATQASEQSELQERILTTDRKLSSLFEKRRLYTSRLGPSGKNATAVMKPRHASSGDGH